MRIELEEVRISPLSLLGVYKNEVLHFTLLKDQQLQELKSIIIAIYYYFSDNNNKIIVISKDGI